MKATVTAWHSPASKTVGPKNENSLPVMTTLLVFESFYYDPVLWVQWEHSLIQWSHLYSADSLRRGLVCHVMFMTLKLDAVLWDKSPLQYTRVQEKQIRISLANSHYCGSLKHMWWCFQGLKWNLAGGGILYSAITRYCMGISHIIIV